MADIMICLPIWKQLMSKIIETKLLRSNVSSLDVLETATNAFIVLGWHPRGALLTATVGDTTIFVQQLVRYDTPQSSNVEAKQCLLLG